MRVLASVFGDVKRAGRRARRLLPLTVDRHRASQEVDPIHREPSSFGLAQAEAGPDHDGRLERLGRRGEERLDLFDRHREDRRRVDTRQPHTVARVAPAEQAVGKYAASADSGLLDGQQRTRMTCSEHSRLASPARESSVRR
jgi:hypothetical protein